MRTIFLGTPQFAVPSLNFLAESKDKPLLVITQPDRPKGRKRKLQSPAVKMAAEQLIESYCKTFKIDYRILRLSNTYGPGDRDASKKKILFSIAKCVKAISAWPKKPRNAFA